MRLQAYLDQSGLSRAEFAKLIGTSEVAITRYIGGKRMPRPELLVKIRDATDGAVTPNDFLPEPGPSGESGEELAAPEPQAEPPFTPEAA